MKLIAVMLGVLVGMFNAPLAAQSLAPPPPTETPGITGQFNKDNKTIIITYPGYCDTLRVNYVEQNHPNNGQSWFRISAAYPDTANRYGSLQLPGFIGEGATLKEALRKLILEVWKDEQNKTWN